MKKSRKNKLKHTNICVFQLPHAENFLKITIFCDKYDLFIDANLYLLSINYDLNRS